MTERTHGTSRRASHRALEQDVGGEAVGAVDQQGDVVTAVARACRALSIPVEASALDVCRRRPSSGQAQHGGTPKRLLQLLDAGHVVVVGSA